MLFVRAQVLFAGLYRGVKLAEVCKRLSTIRSGFYSSDFSSGKSNLSVPGQCPLGRDIFDELRRLISRKFLLDHPPRRVLTVQAGAER